MKNKQTTKSKTNEQKRAAAYAKREKRGTMGPVQTIGSVVGSLAGATLGPLGSAAGFAVGGALGKYAGYYTGTGDYGYNGIGPMQNATFRNNGTVVTHREYITDIVSGPTGTGGTSFDIATFPINPGVSQTFPWLASIASNYEEYEILGMVFTYVSTSGESVASTSTSLGSVILATEYDPTKPSFANKQAMENYEFASSSKPSTSQVHAIECNKSKSVVKQRYVRNSVVPGTDLRWSDYGNFYIATVGYPTAGVTLGELWVTYKVKLLKPRLPITVGLGGQLASGYISRSGATSAAPCGTTTLLTRGTIPISLTPTGITWPALPNMNYIVYVNIQATTVTAVTRTSEARCTGIALFSAGTTTTQNTTAAAQAVLICAEQCINADTDNTSGITISCTITGAANTDILVMQMDETMQ